VAEPQDIEQWMRELRKSEVTERDDSGDYVFRSGTAACHVRGLTGDPAAVRCVAGWLRSTSSSVTHCCAS
jgi:hypothetical protein